MPMSEYDHEEKMRARYARECFYGLTEVVLPAIMSAGSAIGSAAAGAGSAIGSGLGAVGSALGSAGSAIGSGLGSAGTFLGGSGAGTLSGDIAAGLGDIGIGTGTGGVSGFLGDVGAGALEGSGLGAVTGAIQGNPLRGAEMGAITGGTLGGISNVIGGLGSTPATSGGGSAAASAPAPGALPAGSAGDPTVAANYDPSLSAGVTYGGSGPATNPLLGGTQPANSFDAQVQSGGAFVSPPTTNAGPAFTGSTTYPGTIDAEGNYVPGPASPGPANVMGNTSNMSATDVTNAWNANTNAGTPISQPGITYTNPQGQVVNAQGQVIPGGGASGPKSFWNTSVGQLIRNPTSGDAWGNFAASNPGAIVSALGLGYNMMNQGSVKGLNALKTQAQSMQGQSQALMNYINTGTLPSGLQAGIDQSVAAAKQEIKNKYASLGMSGSTAEASDLAYANVNAAAQKGQLEDALLAQGIGLANYTAEDLNNIVNINQKQAEATGNAIANFAAALGGFGGMMPVRSQTQATTTG